MIKYLDHGSSRPDAVCPYQGWAMMAREIALTLDGVDLLVDLSPEQRQSIARCCSLRSLRDGEPVIARGAESREVVFLLAGRLRVIHHAGSGRQIAYAYVDVGEYVGELGVLDGKPRSACVDADGDCLVASLPAHAFLGLLDRHPAVARRLLTRLAGIIRAANQKTVEFGLVSAVQRVHRELFRISRPTPGGRIVSPLPTQDELAALAGTTRETVARTLAHLAKAGVVSRRGRQLLIRESGSLEMLASIDDDYM